MLMGRARLAAMISAVCLARTKGLLTSNAGCDALQDVREDLAVPPPHELRSNAPNELSEARRSESRVRLIPIVSYREPNGMITSRARR
jgi:hypothetical protein